MRILLISYDFPPSANAHAFRWYPMVTEWLADGHHVEVVCGLELMGANAPEHSNLHVHRVGSPFLNRLRGATAENPSTTVSSGNPMKRVLRKLYRALYWPDGLWHWYPSALAKAMELTTTPVDAAITYSPTFVSHLVGDNLKRKGLTRFWLADYGDPFSLSHAMPVNNSKVFSRLNRIWDARVISVADRISFTNEQTKNLYVGIAKGKSLEVIPHAIPRSFLEELPSQSPRAPSVIAYVGALHPVIREPEAAIHLLLSALELCPSDMVIKFVGRTNGVKRIEDPRIHWVGEVNKSEAIDHMRNAAVLVHIENKDVPMTPSKVAEYISTGKPIINFIHRDGTELLMSWQKTFNVFLANPPPPEQLAAVVLGKHRQPSSAEIASHLRKHDARMIARDLEQVFQHPSRPEYEH